MASVKVLFLRTFEQLVVLSKILQIWPLGNQLLIALRYQSSDTSPHQQLCWAEVAPSQWSCLVTEQY